MRQLTCMMYAHLSISGSQETILIFTKLKFYSLYYRPQTKFAKVMFLQVSVCPQGGVCVACGRGEGACVVGGFVWWGHAWQGGRVWQGGMRGGGRACHSRYYGIRSMSGRYASYWNAFLFSFFSHSTTKTLLYIQGG